MKINKPSIMYIIATIAATVYVLLTLLTPPLTNEYNLTSQQILLLRLTIVIPVVIVWYAGAYGFTLLKTYSINIQQDEDGKGIGQLANGIGVLLLGAMLAPTFSTLHSHLYRTTEAVADRTIVTNYISVFMYLVGFGILYLGATKLAKTVNATALFNRQKTKVVIITLLIGLGVIFFGLSRLPQGPVKPYFLEKSQVVLTLYVPYIISWMLAFKALSGVMIYSKKIKGIVYKNVFKKISTGLWLIVGYTVFTQLLNAFSYIWDQLNLTGILALLYVLIVLYGVGYVVIARAAKKLNDAESALVE